MKTLRARSTLIFTASLLTLTLFLTGCPFGDCWGTAAITVTVDRSLVADVTDTILVVQVTRIQKSDVTGTSPEGIPFGPAADNARILDVTFDAATATGHANNLTDPYPTWFYAFVDLNNNRHLDSGEPFGTDPKNPSSPPSSFSCTSDHYQGAITINRRLP